MDNPLDPATVVPMTLDAADFEILAESWPDKATARHYRGCVHRMDVERASQPPVINVAMPGADGHLSTVAGSGEFSYVQGPAPAATAPLEVTAE